jgi:anti-sigma factor ChrR (cupin superfamily)
MQACQDHEHTLWLDVYGELTPQQRQVWESHLTICTPCRAERQRMRNLVSELKQTAQPRQMTAAETETLVSRIVRQQSRRRWRLPGTDRPMGRWAPAFTMAGVLLVALGIVAHRWLLPSTGGLPVDLDPARNPAIAQDLDVIQNLDMLKDMDELQKLVKMVDNNQKTPPDPDTRGMIRDAASEMSA